MNEFQELYNGMKLPNIGFGVWQIPKGVIAHCVKLALKAGYRYIDTARYSSSNGRIWYKNRRNICKYKVVE